MELLNSYANLSLKKSAQSLRRPKRNENEGTILQLLGQDKRYSMIAEIIEKSDSLRNELDSEEARVTFFAPTNEALTKFQEILKNIENGKNKRYSRRNEVDLPKMEDILRYHTVKKEVAIDDMYEGMLLPTELKIKELGDRKHQRIHVSRRLGSIYLNMTTRVESMNVKAVNGFIHPVDWVLLPPWDALSIVINLPFICSTFASAVQHCGLDKELLEGNTMSVFVPTDSAWKQMPFTDLVYLFSPLGRRDLKKILEYHISLELTYAKDIVDSKDEISVPTLLENEEIRVKCVELPVKEALLDDFSFGRKSMPDNYMIVLNEGEARVKYADVITRNGNVHLINSVLVPEGVCLPSRRWGGRGDEFDFSLEL